MMTGLWLFTNLAVAVLTGQLKTAAGGSHPWTDRQVSAIMLVATAASALTMTLAGHVSTTTGRRTFLAGFGFCAAVLAPAAYLLTRSATSFPVVTAGAALLNVVTVSGYGPIGAYLAERFPREVRASGYGVGYSLSIVLPALYPFYLPPLQATFGPTGAVAGLLAVAGVFLATGAALGPETYRDQPLSKPGQIGRG